MKNEILWNELYTKRNRVIAHVVFWSFIAFLYYFSYLRYDPNLAWLLSLKDLFIVLTIFYSTAYFAIPKWILKGKFIQSVLWILVTYFWWGILTYLSCLFIDHSFVPDEILGVYIEAVLNKGPMAFFQLSKIDFYILDYFYLIALPVGLKLMQSFVNQRAKEVKLERDNLELELNFLKSQINPHFLFNSLNNIYRMVNKNDPKTPDAVLSLAGLMRYTLYESDDHFVPLKNEISFIKDFIKLERLRYSSKVEIKDNILQNGEDHFIVPLILFPFIENAFKHGPEKSNHEAWVHLNLKVKDNLLTLEVSNSIGKARSKNTVGGVGMVNVRKRLELNYKDRYDLETTASEDSYKVLLKIQLPDQSAN